jgi:Ca-activated chloride channel homolog
MGSHSRPRTHTRIIVAAVILVVGMAGAGAILATRGHGPVSSRRAAHPQTTFPAPKTRSGIPTPRTPSAATDRLPTRPGAVPCTSLHIMASMEDRELIVELAHAYRGSRRDIAGHCVSVVVDAIPSGQATEEVVTGFRGTADSRKPTIWWPDSSDWLSITYAAQTSARSRAVPRQSTSIAHTPIVLAMPRPQAAALGWVRRPPTWNQYLRLSTDPNMWARHGHPEWGTVKVGKTNPQTATSGLDGLVAAYKAVSGSPAVLNTGVVDSASVQAAVHDSEKATVHYGSSEEHFLAHIRDAESTGNTANFLSAVILDEKSVWDYNRGHLDMTGTAMNMTGSGEDHELGPPKTTLVPIYPRDGTYIADSPAAILHAPWVNAAKRRSATDLIRFARTSQGQRAVRAAGYRDLTDAADPQVISTGHYRASAVRTLPTPSAGVLRAVQKSFPAVRRRARVLFAIDVSGSMRAVLPDGHTKLQDAKRAVVKAARYFTGTDQVGLAAFSNRAGRQRVIPGVIDPLSRNPAKLTTKINRLIAVDQTPLYRAVAQFVRAMVGSYNRNDIDAIVVLSDGKNDTDAGGTLASLQRQISTTSKDKPIRIFTLGYGADADRRTLQRIAELTGAHFYDATDPDTIDTVLSDLVTNF